MLARVNLARAREVNLAEGVPGRAAKRPTDPTGPSQGHCAHPVLGTTVASTGTEAIVGDKSPNVQMVFAQPPSVMAVCRNCFALRLQILFCLRKLSVDD